MIEKLDKGLNVSNGRTQVVGKYFMTGGLTGI
jgi:hypothetical protein